MRIMSGSVVIKPNIKCFTKTGVEFDNGTFEDNVDAVIFATGYIFGFPCVEPGIIDVNNNVVDLYKYTFPPNLTHSTMAVIGCFQPLGSTMPISEMQCRWAARVFNVCETLSLIYLFYSFYKSYLPRTLIIATSSVLPGRPVDDDYLQ